MRNGKKLKTIDRFTVSQLLDDFLRPATEANGTSVNEIDDEEYIRMMLEKEKQRTIERKKRVSQLKRSKTPSPQKDILDENIRQRYFPDMYEGPPKKEVLPEDIFVEEILDTLVVKDVSDLAAKMKQAVDFLQEEMGTSD
ncbi:MAG: hypothetical protein ACXAC0_08960 [Candidatus Thorarchaeota archaeon]|jgi:hypothetical protein